jgi:hypothetical protein
MEKNYAIGMNLRIEDRDPTTFQGVNGVGNGVTQWITQDAVVKIKFATKKVESFTNRGKPVEGVEDQYVEVNFRFGLVEIIGTPCIIGADSLRALDGIHYYNPDKLVLGGVHCIECMSLDKAQEEARRQRDEYWSDIIQEEVRQVNRIKSFQCLGRRVRLAPGHAAIVWVTGNEDTRKEDISLVQVINNPGNRNKFRDLRVRDGYCCGQPMVTVVNVGTDPITIYKTDLQFSVTPQKMGFQWVEDQTEEIREQINKIEKEKVRSNVAKVVNNMSCPIKIIPEVMWPLMSPEFKTRAIENYKVFGYYTEEGRIDEGIINYVGYL